MKKQSIFFKRRGEKNPAIQNLRKFLHEYLEGGGSRQEFAKRLHMMPERLSQCVTGVYTPTKKTVEKWAEDFGISYDEMMTANFAFISYPFDDLPKPIPNHTNRHLTKKFVKKRYESMIDEYETMVEEGVIKYESKVVDLMKRYMI